jgi:hypothetical protein
MIHDANFEPFSTVKIPYGEAATYGCTKHDRSNKMAKGYVTFRRILLFMKASGYMSSQSIAAISYYLLPIDWQEDEYVELHITP